MRPLPIWAISFFMGPEDFAFGRIVFSQVADFRFLKNFCRQNRTWNFVVGPASSKLSPVSFASPLDIIGRVQYDFK